MCTASCWEKAVGSVHTVLVQHCCHLAWKAVFRTNEQFASGSLSNCFVMYFICLCKPTNRTQLIWKDKNIKMKYTFSGWDFNKLLSGSLKAPHQPGLWWKCINFVYRVTSVRGNEVKAFRLLKKSNMWALYLWLSIKLKAIRERLLAFIANGPPNCCA